MSSGKAHDLSIALVTPIAIIASATYLPGFFQAPFAPLIAVGGYLIGGIWLSPDIDLKQSRPSQRLGLLSLLWQPYRQASGHRGFSHVPLVGTASRLIYIAIPAILWAILTSYNPSQLLWQQREVLGSLYLGLELSTWLHLCMDYIPVLNRN